jgi:serine protease Do
MPTPLLRIAALLVVLLPGTAHAAAEDRLSRAVERGKQATVGILDSTPDARQSGFEARFSLRGTGVHLRDGYILTVRHAVERTEGGKTVLPKRIIILTQGHHELAATLVGGTGFLDLALYQFEPPDAPLLVTTTVFAGGEALPGQEVFTVGYPLGWGPVIAFGRMGNVNAFLPTVETRLLQATLPSCNGNSGGGLFNTDGELVGIMHAVIKTELVQGEAGCSHLAFAVPGTLAKKIVEALVKGEQPGFARLGIQLTVVKVGSRWRTAAGKVSEPALAGGVQKGDLLLAIDGKEIRDAAFLKNYLMEHAVPGQPVTLLVKRSDKELTLTVTAGRASDER